MSVAYINKCGGYAAPTMTEMVYEKEPYRENQKVLFQDWVACKAANLRDPGNREKDSYYNKAYDFAEEKLVLQVSVPAKPTFLDYKMGRSVNPQIFNTGIVYEKESCCENQRAPFHHTFRTRLRGIQTNFKNFLKQSEKAVG